MLPGEFIARIYEEHGPRLLELNVRSFLQSRGKVNRGIQETIRNEPAQLPRLQQRHLDDRRRGRPSCR